jgi:glycosyltransferase involved in cell wall biosynthesis
MIVKNEESNLGQCLLSVEPLVDEMIVVDTGSTDRTKEIAKAFGAKVYNFEWTHDFSEARNMSLSKASGDWILILDADEVLSRKDFVTLRKLAHKKKYDCAYALTTRNYVDRSNLEGCKTNDGLYEEEAGLGWLPSYKVRLFPNDPNIRFENPVHELVEPSLKSINKKILNCSVPVHHYGKLNNEKSLAKGEEYYLLGKKKLEERGDDRLALLELALQAAELKKFDEAIDLWHRLLKIEPDFAKAHFNLGYIYLKLGQYEAGIKASKKASELDPNIKETVLNYSSCELYGGSVGNAAEALENAVRKYPDYIPSIALLGIAYIVGGKHNEGFACIEKIKKMNIDGPGVISDHAKEFIRAGRIELAVLLLENAVSHGYVNQNILTQLEELKKR